ncbi:sensor histidine kinase [Kitasatospora sp. NPDC101801]|uniref:sensor histidine kinase n=1 Tax=Kitasatospora sp. NPDC101801 TaxID=3364103 RepID=UPI00380E7419
MTTTRPMAWGGALLYPLVLLLLVGGALRSPNLYGLGALLAGGLLTGVVRRAPGWALMLTLLGAVAMVAVGGPGESPGRFLPFLAADLVLGFIVAGRSRRVSVPAAVLSALVQAVTAFAFMSGPDRQVAVAMISVLLLGTCCLGGLLFRERREHAVQLRSQEVAEAVTAERLRIARELHDMVAHSIGIIAIQAGVGSRVIETQPTEARQALQAIEATSRETLAGLRRTLVALRQADPGTGAPLGPAPGLADLDQLVAATADAGVSIDLRRSGDRRQLPADLDLSAYRIVQEAVTNVVRHAGTGHCRVTVDYGAGELSVEVLDEGCGRPGSEVGGAGFGITGMRERVSLLHGRFSAGPRPEGGFRVTARLPLPEPVGSEPAVAGAETR